MSTKDKTVYDGGVTIPESGNTTMPETNGTTIPENGGTTAFEGTVAEAAIAEAAAHKGETFSNDDIQKDSVLMDTYRVDSDPIHGGMGSVWRVRHQNWSVDLAMKRPQAKLFVNETQKANFIRECEAWINLGLHPNIVSCYYVRELGGVPTIFSEWMENGSLENRIKDGNVFEGTEEEVQKRLLDIAIQFARGLHYAHEAGLIHQDVKPDNLLLSKEWDAKVADFGLARARAQLTALDGAATVLDGDPGATAIAPSGAYTPAYCSMEQMDKKPLTRRTDIYSWAVSIMELYLGEKPWTNGVVAGLNCKDYFEMCRVPMPDKLKELLAKCMAAEPKDRPRDFGEVEAVLRELYEAITNTPYSRPVPDASAVTANSLHNRALSLLELGQRAAALQIWDRVLQMQPQHAEALLSRSLYLWRSGKGSVETLEQALLQVEQSETYHYESRVFPFIETIRAEIASGRGASAYPICHIIAYSDVSKFQNAMSRARPALEKGDYETACGALTEAQRTWSGWRDPERLFLSEGLADHCVGRWPRQMIVSPVLAKDLEGACSVDIDAEGARVLAAVARPGNPYICLFDAKTGKQLRSAMCLSRSVPIVRFTSDGKHALYGADGQYSFMDLDTGKISPIRGWTNHRSDRAEKQCVFSRNLVLAVVLAYDPKRQDRYDYVLFWDIYRQKIRKELRFPKGTIQSISVSDNGKRVLLGCRGGAAALYNEKGKLQREETENARMGAFFPTKAVLCGDGRGYTKCFGGGFFSYLATDFPPFPTSFDRKAAVPSMTIQTAAYTPDNRFLLLMAANEKMHGTRYGAFYFYECDTGKVTLFYPPLQGAAREDVRFSANGLYCMLGGQIWRLDWDYEYHAAEKTPEGPDNDDVNLFGKIFGLES